MHPERDTSLTVVENSWALKFIAKCKSWKMQQYLVVIFCTSDDLQQNPPKKKKINQDMRLK